MRRINFFTWILFILLVIGIFSALRNNFLELIIPLVIFGLIFYFYKKPNILNFFRNGRYRNQHKNNRYNKGSRKSSFTVIDGKFKENKNNNPDDNINKQ